jgi:hypothetical protein
VLAILAMLARKPALCVVPGGSAPPIPSVAHRGSDGAGRDGKAGLGSRTGKRVLSGSSPDTLITITVIINTEAFHALRISDRFILYNGYMNSMERVRHLGD